MYWSVHLKSWSAPSQLALGISVCPLKPPVSTKRFLLLAEAVLVLIRAPMGCWGQCPRTSKLLLVTLVTPRGDAHDNTDDTDGSGANRELRAPRKIRPL